MEAAIVDGSAHYPNGVGNVPRRARGVVRFSAGCCNLLFGVLNFNCRAGRPCRRSALSIGCACCPYRPPKKSRQLATDGGWAAIERIGFNDILSISLFRAIRGDYPSRKPHRMT